MPLRLVGRKKCESTREAGKTPIGCPIRGESVGISTLRVTLIATSWNEQQERSKDLESAGSLRGRGRGGLDEKKSLSGMLKLEDGTGRMNED